MSDKLNNEERARIRAAAIEECAKVCEDMAEVWNNTAQDASNGRYDFMSEAGDRCADEIRDLAASPAPAIPAADPVAIRDAALEAAAAAVEDHQRAGREWVNDSLWDTLSCEAAARIRALKAAPAIPLQVATPIEDARNEGTS